MCLWNGRLEVLHQINNALSAHYQYRMDTTYTDEIIRLSSFCNLRLFDEYLNLFGHGEEQAEDSN